MIALQLRFPAGRYHATPWGRHVNEAALAWPPEPLRILRALIACHHRKADRALFSRQSLAELIEALAAELPYYKLPEAIHAHTRHYMPAPAKTTLIFDAFARFDPEDPLVVGWPQLALNQEQHSHFEHLAVRLGYLGRAESWVEATVIEWDGQNANARPQESGTRSADQGTTTHSPDLNRVSLYAPLSPEQYREARSHLIQEERDRRRTGWTKKSKPTDKAIENDMKDFLATLPERLADALAVETSNLQAVGWSDPPAVHRALYSAPELRTAWLGVRRNRVTHEQSNPTVARFVLAGRPRPRVEDTLRIAEIMRLAAMARFGWESSTGRRRPKAPGVISGYGPDGKPLRGDNHAHAFWLPEDADNDGELEHVIVYASGGFNSECRRRLDQITRLWIGDRDSDDDDETAKSANTEWRLALEGFGSPKDFAAASPLLGQSAKWVSVTPYLLPWHTKKNFRWTDQLAREIVERGLPELAEPARDLDSIIIKGRERRPIHFHRFRSRRGLTQPDTLGRFVQLTFKEEISGPLALGYACHFGLGLLRPVE
ncbi:MAG TPA: type I-U CRISPR-associated protein Csb2 [Rhizomicrobium sp.]|nr:type I-U CRISPR-associated protein Csb2 [Rhizomicrobium sp.]